MHRYLQGDVNKRRRHVLKVYVIIIIIVVELFIFILNSSFKKKQKKFVWREYFSTGDFSWESSGALPHSYERLHFKREPYRYSGQRYIQTQRQKDRLPVTFI